MKIKDELESDTIVDLGPETAVLISKDVTVGDAVKELQQQRHGSACVCDGGKLVGIFTERDLLKKVLNPKKPLDTPITEVMTANPRTLNIKEKAAVALDLFDKGGFRHIPVVNENNEPTGMLSIKCMINYLVEMFPDLILNLPPEPGSISTSVSGG
jgi:CBS domain-containing protein